MPRPVLLAVGGDPAAKTTIERELRMCNEAIKLLLGHLLPGAAAPRGGT
jgi:hypothetical protein